jgi:hypothetical protein
VCHSGKVHCCQSVGRVMAQGISPVHV